MRALRIVLTALGILIVLTGLLWLFQGLGIIRWPAESFMIDQRPWVTRGSLVGAAGILLILIAGRIR